MENRLAESHTEIPEGITCDICGADKTRLGVPFTTLFQLAVHKRMVHDGAGKRGAATRAKNLRLLKNKVENVKPRKVIRRKSKYSISSTRSETLSRFCPRCGCNMEIVNRAMEIANETN